MEKKDLRIVYMGTPDFAVESLRALVENGYNVVAVVTMPDKPAGRGHKLQYSPVKQYALQHNLPLLQPEKLKDEQFLTELRSYNAHLQIVVAFRMLPQVVWSMPPMGTFNLHASLLPQYRGAAPINWAVINGETETGVTTIFLQHEIDTGHIIFQKKTPIDPNENVGTVHDRLMMMGAKLVVRTVDAILEENLNTVSEIATQLQMQEKTVKNFIVNAIQKKFLTGFIFDGNNLTPNQKETPNRKIAQNKCKNCGATMHKLEDGWKCEYCGAKFDFE